MNKKALTLAILFSMATTGAFASDLVTTTVNNSGKLSKLQEQAVLLTQKQLADKAAKDVATFPSALALNEVKTVDLALKNNRTAKQSMWAYEAAKSTVSATAASKNPSVGYSYSATRARGATDASSVTERGTNGFSLSVPVYTPSVDAAIDGARYDRESAGASYEEALQTAKLTAISDYYTLIMYRNLVDVAQQSVRDYDGHVTNVQAQYNVGLVASSDVLAARTNLADAQTTLITRQNSADVAETDLNIVIGYPVSTSIETADKEMRYLPYNVTLEQAKAYALLHRATLVKSAMDVKSAEESVKQAKAGYLPTVSLTAGKNYASDDNYRGTSNNGWSVGANASLDIWDGGSTRNTIKVREAQLESAKEANLAAVDGVLYDVQSAYLNLRAAEQTISSTKVAVEEGQESFRIASLRYRAGVGSNLDVLDAETSLTTARNNYVQALYNYNIYVATLEQAVGVPLETPVGHGAPLIANSDSVNTLANLAAQVTK
ncbi:TolC family protein [Veillonella sp. YH-vei2232]|uniref:TolC family protein n=1 Tax=Veillonella absiana TaxID=3079305 RepID=A0ABU3Z9U9_9FIRM|nr:MULTISPECIES: TolC family protein [unclassified Veillonella]MDV5063207.1 TolC family protein [Veillonella sp. YH-vei2232]MDV5088683.1 TolC family protein [Veillonella sp. YH-vei2233]